MRPHIRTLTHLLNTNMLIVKVKICGLTNYRDAAAAVDMGADLLGFNFYPESPRFITPEQAAQIINKLPAFIHVAGVFVNASLDQIKEAISECNLDWVQLHGDESPEFCESLLSINVRTMKAAIRRIQGFHHHATAPNLSCTR